jgi:citrate lyase subunit beta/citryl-CoA lyase
MMAKAASSDADLVFLDLEDAVAPSEKVGARAKIIAALRNHDWGHKTRAVRINSLDTQWAYEDVIDVVENAGEHLDIIIIPKVKRAADVQWVDVLLTQIETKLGTQRRIGLEVLIREVEAMINAEEIAALRPGSKRSSSAPAITPPRRACARAPSVVSRRITPAMSGTTPATRS